MKTHQVLVFDEYLNSGFNLSTAGYFDELLGREEQLEIQIVVEAVVAATSVTVAHSTSADDRNWFALGNILSAQAIDNTKTWTYAAAGATSTLSKYAQLTVSIAGTNGSARVRVYATLRGDYVADKAPEFTSAVPGATAGRPPTGGAPSYAEVLAAIRTRTAKQMPDGGSGLR